MRKVLALYSVLVCLLSLFTMSGAVSAAGRSTSTAPSHSTSAPQFDVPFTAAVDFAAVQKNCPHVSIHLNGAQHTLTCLKSQGVQPNLYRSPCGLQNIQVDNYNYTGVLCFNGSGYLGVGIYQVNDVTNLAGQANVFPMWMRYYRKGGVSCFLWAYDSFVFGSGNTNVTVTQLDWGTAGGYSHC